MKAILIFPNQLFEHNSLLEKIHKSKDVIIFAEDFLFFRQYKFHKQKLVLHRATMKFYQNYLKNLGYKTQYVESNELQNRKDFGGILASKKISEIFCYEVVDNYLETDINNFSKKLNIKVNFEKTPMFLNSDKENSAFFTKPDGSMKKPFMKTFYEWQRNRLNILMLDKNKPAGGKYSYDAENRKKLPKDYIEPKNNILENNNYVNEALIYVGDNFKDNYGDLVEKNNFNYATNFSEAKKHLQYFLEEKLENFGVYEDSISTEFKTINHSVLTPYLNIGLLTPEYVIKETLKFAKENSKIIPLNSLEGFIRQIIGWREFMRAMYILNGKTMRSVSFFKHSKKLEEGWWTGEVESCDVKIIPVNNCIKSLINSGYNHHIERLMVLGNFMLLSEYSPDEVYRWFMSMYIDSYDWVMVPNIYGMSQFADGGIFATKPYISSSNYIFKMSDYKKEKDKKIGESWHEIWDKLFWDFLKKHRVFLSKNIRFKMLLGRIK